MVVPYADFVRAQAAGQAMTLVIAKTLDQIVLPSLQQLDKAVEAAQPEPLWTEVPLALAS